MRRVLLIVLLSCLVILGSAAPASAHDVLVGSDPAAGAVLTTSPATVGFSFNAPIQESSYDTITISGPHATRWPVYGSRVYGDSITASPGPLGPSGQYVFAYRIVSADGHPLSGQITVTLTDPGLGRPVTAQPAVQHGGDVPGWVWLLIAVVLVGLISLVLRQSRAPR